MAEILAEWDSTSELEKVHIVPFCDTLPHAYEFDVFNDYLKPYFLSNPHKKFKCGDLFIQHGVQFKVVGCQPEIPARIGGRTTIYCDGALQPSLQNLLPADLLQEIEELPEGLRRVLLNTHRQAAAPETILERRNGLFETTLADI